MFKFGFDETARDAPDWYADVNKQLERDSYDEAARIAKETAKRCQETGDKKGELQASLVYIKALLATGDVWNARRFGEQAMDLANALQDKSLEGAAVHMLAKAMLKDPQERRVASALGSRAVTYSELCARQAGKGLTDAQQKESWQTLPSAAAAYVEQGAKLFADAGNKLGEASVLTTSATLALKGKQFADADRLAGQAIVKFQELGNAEGEAAAQYVLYEMRLKEELLDGAVEALDAIVACLQNLPNPSPSLGSALYLSAELQRSQGDLQDAVQRAAQAAQHFHDACDGNNKGQAVLSMAKSFLEAQQNDDAAEAAGAAVELFKASRNKSGQAQALAIIAECCKNSGKKAEAVYRLEEAAFLHRQRKDKKNEAKTLNSLSLLQVSMLESGMELALTEPLRHARRAANLLEEVGSGESTEGAQANHTVAKLMLHNKDDLEEAATHAARARDIYDKLGVRLGESAACALLSQICFEDKNTAEGQKMAQRSLDLAHETGDQTMLVLATDLVTNQGKKKEAPMVELTNMTIIFNKIAIARFDEFEGRRARYKDVGGGSGAASAAIQDAPGKDKAGVRQVEEQKVQYVIRWQRVANLNLAAMPIPPEVRSK